MSFGRATHTVTDPDGRAWTVRRVLLPRPPRWKGKSLPKEGKRQRVKESAKNWADVMDGLDFAGSIGEVLGPVGAAIAAIVFVAAALAFAWLVVFPALFFLVDVLIILLIAAVGVAIRILFRRPWRIEARPDDGQPGGHSWGIVGLRASAEAVTTVADAIRRGTPPDEIRLDGR